MTRRTTAARPIPGAVVRYLFRLLVAGWVFLKWRSMKQLMDDSGMTQEAMWDALSNFVPEDWPPTVGLVGNITIWERAPRLGVADSGGQQGNDAAAAHGPSPAAGDRASSTIRSPAAIGNRTASSPTMPASPRPPTSMHTGCAEPRFLIKVFAYKRRASLDRLLRSLSVANYMGDSVPIEFYIEGGAPQIVVDYIHNFRWSHGPPPRINLRKERVGLMDNIVESWDPPEDEACEFAILLEDDIEVSPHFYYYAKSLLVNSKYADDADLVGLSFYTPKWNEIKYPNVGFKVPTSDPLFLMQLPCSWGAVYFPWHWREFRKYFAERRNFEKGVGGIDVPPLPEGARSNSWERSWKRYYIEYMFYRGLLMLYPNFQKEKSLATTHRELGEHTGPNLNKGRDKLTKAKDWERYIQSLVAFRSELDKQLKFSDPPRLKEMDVVNLYHRPASREEIKRYATITSFGNISSNTRREYLDKVHGEGFCALDVSGQRVPQSSGKKYFLYDPQNGLSNQIMQLQGAVVMAQQLGRTLVVPPVVADDGTLLDPSDLFDLSSLPVAWVHYRDYDGAPRVKRLVDRTQRKRFLSGSQEDFFHGLGLDAAAAGNGGGGDNEGIARVDYDSIYEKERLTDEELKALFGGCPDETLAITNIFLLYATPPQMEKDPDFVRIPEWSGKVKAAATKREEALRKSASPSLKGKRGSDAGNLNGMYSCLHLRRGDFENFCDHVRLKRLSKDPAPYDSYWYRPFKYENCFMNPSDVRKVLAPRMKPGEALYVATNEQNRTVIKEGFRGMTWKTASGFSQEERTLDPRLLPALDQAFCEGSRVLYFNRWSSFSKNMARRREAHGKKEFPSLELGLGKLSFR